MVLMTDPTLSVAKGMTMRLLLLTLSLIALVGCRSAVDSAIHSGDTEALLAALEESGATVTRDIDGQVTQISCGGPYSSQITDAGLELLNGLTSLEELNLDLTQITDAGLTHLSGLSNLKWLDLTGTQITDDGLEHLKGLTSLETLGLIGTEVTDIKHLKGLTNLEILYLQSTRVTDAGLEHLKGLSSLKSLDLDGTQITRV